MPSRNNQPATPPPPVEPPKNTTPPPAAPKVYEPTEAEITAKIRASMGGLDRQQAIEVLKQQHAHDQALKAG